MCGNARRREEVKGCNATAEDGSCRQLVKGTKNGGMERRTPRHTKRTLGCGSARSAGQQANLVHERRRRATNRMHDCNLLAERFSTMS